MSLTGPTRSLMNNIAASSEQPVPVVGMGATKLMATDRKAFTIVEVITPKRIKVQRDKVTRLDKNGMSECQKYEYAADPDGSTYIVTLRKNGRWVVQGDSADKGTAFLIGDRCEYHDFSF